MPGRKFRKPTQLSCRRNRRAAAAASREVAKEFFTLRRARRWARGDLSAWDLADADEAVPPPVPAVSHVAALPLRCDDGN